MFLESLRRRNPALIEQSIALHQAGKIPANSYVIDLDAVEGNARTIAGVAAKFGLKTYAMTKQMGRNGSFCRAVAKGGIDRAVAVDMECARAVRRAGLGLGHIGHLVQVPRQEADAAASMTPDHWTVFNLEKAAEAGSGVLEAGPRPSPSWLASLRRAIRSIAVMRAVFRRTKSSPSPTPSIGCRAHDSPASRAFRRNCSIMPAAR